MASHTRNLDDLYKCAVCLNDPVVPYQICKEGHHACRTCANRLTLCHVCRGALVVPIRNLLALQVLTHMTGNVACFKCDVIMAEVDMKTHVCTTASPHGAEESTSTSTRTSTCPDGGAHDLERCPDCGAQVRHIEMSMHANVCEMGTVECKSSRCRQRIRRKNIAAHDQTCAYAKAHPWSVVKCPHCALHLNFVNLPAHLANVHVH